MPHVMHTCSCGCLISKHLQSHCLISSVVRHHPGLVPAVVPQLAMPVVPFRHPGPFRAAQLMAGWYQTPPAGALFGCPQLVPGHPLRVLEYQGTGPRLRLPRLYLDDPDMAYPCPTHRSSIVAVVGARDVWEADAAIFYECLRRQEGSSSRLERRLRRGGQALARTYEMSAQLERCHVQTTVCHPAAVLPILVCCSKRLSASVSDRSSSRFGCDYAGHWTPRPLLAWDCTAQHGWRDSAMRPCAEVWAAATPSAFTAGSSSDCSWCKRQISSPVHSVAVLRAHVERNASVPEYIPD